MNRQAIERLQVKTPEHRFLSILKNEFHEPPRVAQAMLEEAQACLLGGDEPLRAGQMRITLAQRGAKHGQPLADTPMTEVTWTIDAGLEDMWISWFERGSYRDVSELADNASEQLLALSGS